MNATAQALDDRRALDLAFRLAARGWGKTAENPSVGCVLVRGGVVVGRGTTASGGRPHAETIALTQAGDRAKGATAYVTLEPCSHHGQTPPCAEALITAGIVRVVVGARDPDPRVNGAGVEKLETAGIAADVLENSCASLGGFAKRLTQDRPWVTLKVAASLDGKLATAIGDSQWITGPQARAWGHALRARHDAVLSGAATVLADNAQLTVRLAGLDAPESQPLRVVLDPSARLLPGLAMIQAAAQVPVLVLTLAANRDTLQEKLGTAVRVESCSASDGLLDLSSVLRLLAAQGCNRLMVEAGSRLSGAFLRSGLVDMLAWFHAPLMLGGDGMSAVASLGVDRLSDAVHVTRSGSVAFGADRLDLFCVGQGDGAALARGLGMACLPD